MSADVELDTKAPACEANVRLRRSLTSLLLLALVGSLCAAGERPLRAARSENGRFRLRIHPGRPGNQGRPCRAALFDRDSRGREPVWAAELVNEIAPGRAFIRDDGRLVVTLDEFRRGGATHAVVIYGADGRCLREFGLRELLRGDDWRHVRRRDRAVEWLSGASFAFVVDPPHFVIRLRWGRQIRIDLTRLRVVDGERAPACGPAESEAAASERVDAKIPAEILALLAEAATEPATQPTADDAAQQAAVAAALAELERLARQAGIELAPAPEPAPAGGLQASFAGNSAAAGLPVPEPDPANPVDYLAWLAEQMRTEGPSAVPVYRAASEAYVPWTGDEELYDQALEGDPEALASPEVAAWLEANQDALANFRAATELEYRGSFENAESDSLIGVLLPRLASRRDLARAAIIEGKRLESAGRADAAASNYLDTLAAGTQTTQSPILIENLVGLAIQALAADRLLDCFAGPGGDGLDYVRLAAELEGRYQPARPVSETLQTERAMVLDLIQHVYEWNPETGCYRVSPDGLARFGVSVGGVENSLLWGMSAFALGAIGFEKIVAQTNDHFDALTEAAMLPYPEATQHLSELEEEIGSPAFRVRNPLLATLLPSVFRYKHVATRGATIRQATRLITNLKAYRQQYGKYPDSLDVFGDSEMVVDPFTGRRFVYRRVGDDFQLYSLGGNGVDDGGVHNWRGDSGDLVFWPRRKQD